MIIDVTSTKSFTINIGRQGENDITKILFDCSGLVDEFGEGTLSCILQRKKTDEPYPVPLTYEEHIATWSVSDVDTFYAGTGKIQLSYAIGEQIKKSIIYKVKVEPSVISTSGDVPSPVKSYLDQMVEIGTQVHEDALSAKASAQEAESYAENLHFDDDGNGNVTIRIGG